MKPSTLLSSLIAIALVSLTAHRANATTRTVTNLNDSGTGSLRQAIIDSASGDTINFAVTGTISLTSGELQINHDLTITGPGAASLVIRRSTTSFFRIFFFDNGTWNVSGLTISNGHDTVVGGGIYNGNGNLTVTDCTITGNYSNSSGGGISNNSDGLSTNVTTTVRNCAFIANISTDGGAIANSIGTLTVSNCTFTANDSNHGTISNKQLGAGSGNLTVNNCTFSNNVADLGGALHGGPVTVTNCTFKNNGDAARTGAGGAIRCGGGTVTNCTFSNNIATKGGAIYSSGSLTVLSCTFSGNSADLGNSIGIDGSATVLHLGNTILQSAGANFFVDTGGPSVSSMGYNLSSDNGGGFLAGPADQINTDPLLDTYGLQNNGGPTQTIALTPESPAIDQGKAFGLVTDQRGQPRTIDDPDVFPAVGGDGTDIGAYESPADPVQCAETLVVTTTDDHDDGVAGVRDCTLREAIQRANARPGPNTIVFAANVTGTITLQTGLGELVINDSTTINGPGARNMAVSGNEAHRVLNVSAGTSTVSGLTIRDGWNAGSSGGVTRIGGGIYNLTTLTLSDCTLTNNFVQGGGNNDGQGGAGGSAFGGGVYNAGTLTLNRCSFCPNSGNGEANTAGGGQGSNINSIGGNPAGAGGEAEGGAVFNNAGATLNINNCTLNGNGASGGNGGNGPLSSGGNGGAASGAIYNLGTMTMTASTISGNIGHGGTGGTGNHGSNGANGIGIGGVASGTGGSTVRNTISAGNSGNNGGGSDVNGAFISGGYNLIGIGDFSSGFNATADQVGTTAAPINPHLGPLQNNGGPTNTMALLSNSPAIDQGKSFGLTTDQRSFGRTVDTSTPNASGGDGTDIGSYEVGGRLSPFTAVSRKFHGNNPTPFDVPLPLSGPIGVECRRNTGADTIGLNVGKDHEVVLTFASVVTAVGSVVVTDSNNNTVSSSFTRANNVVTIDLHGVPNACRLTIRLNSVSDVSETVNLQVPMGILLGDTSGNGTVNASDVSQTKSKSGQTVDATNFREDVTVNDSINASDVSLVKSRSGTALP